MSHSLLKLIAVALFILSPFKAFSLNVQRFTPTTDQYEGFSNMGSSTLKPGAFHIALFFNHVDDPLEFNIVGANSQVAPIVDHFNTLNLTPHIGIFKWLSVGASLPFNLSTSVRNDIPNFSQQDDYSWGDAQIFLKLRLADNKKNAFGLALIPTAAIPMDLNIQDQFNNADYSLGAKLALDTWLNKTNYIALNFGGMYRAQDENLQNLLQVSHDLNFGLSYVHHFSSKKQTDLFLEMNGRTELSDPFSSGQQSPVETVLGLRHRMFKNKLTVFLGGGRGVTNGFSTPNYRIFSGLQFSYRKDQESKPEPIPEEKPKEIPNIGQIYLQIFDENRDPLPATIIIRDQNGDLVARANDQELRTNLKPANYDIYIEKEGYTFAQKTVALKKGKRTKQGIILDKVKVKAKAQVKGEKIEYLGKILFNFNEASLRPESYEILDSIVDILQRHQEVRKIRVEAHTDSKGSETYNLELSVNRANSVRDYLFSSGLDPERLDSIGLGESQPIASNETEEGRAKNRRVEFTILESSSSEVRVTP